MIRSRPQAKLIPATLAFLACIASSPASAATAEAGSALPVPTPKAPRFPLEPGKKPAQPVNPASYVEGASSPPAQSLTGAIEPAVPELVTPASDWADTLRIGWFYTDAISNHVLTQASGTQIPVRRESASPLSLALRFDARVPESFLLPLSIGLDAAVSTGKADAVTSASQLPASRFSYQDASGVFGLDLHLFGRSAPVDLSVGGGIGLRDASYATLTQALDAIDVDSRLIIYGQPRVRFHYAPRQNWEMSLNGTYSGGITTSGTGDVRGNGYHRYSVGAEGLKRLAPGSAVGLGASYDAESVTWVQTSPVPLTDPVDSTEVRISVLYKRDF